MYVQNVTVTMSFQGLHVNDWQLSVIILSLTAVSVVLVTIGSAVPQLRPVAILSSHVENPTGQNVWYFVS